MTRPAPTHCPQRRLVARHFSASISLAKERDLRTHLPACASCSAFYERHLLYETVTRARRPPWQRLAAGLGIGVPGRPRPMTRVLQSSLVVAGTVAAAALFLLHGRPTPDVAGEGFAPRGTLAPAALAARIDVYRVAPGQPPTLAAGRITARDELAFAYRNPRGFRYLLLFGVDEQHNVYWFHPAWTDAKHPPVAIPIQPGAAPRELGEAVSHDLRGRQLRVMAVFANQPLSVTTIEEQIRSGRFEMPDTERSETLIEVAR